jgi:hypothetical protein
MGIKYIYFTPSLPMVYPNNVIIFVFMEKDMIKSWKETTIGWNESPIAKNEKNDCVVLTFSNVFNIHYDTAHWIVKKYFGRVNRDGVTNFPSKLNNFINGGNKIGDKGLTPVGTKVGNYHLLHYLVKSRGKMVMRHMTVGKFLKDNPQGRFILLIKGHAFTIIDGNIVGNTSDHVKLKRRLWMAWRVS